MTDMLNDGAWLQRSGIARRLDKFSVVIVYWLE